MNKKEHLQIEGLKNIVNLKASLNIGLPLSLKEAFPDATAIEKPLFTDINIRDPQ